MRVPSGGDGERATGGNVMSYVVAAIILVFAASLAFLLVADFSIRVRQGWRPQRLAGTSLALPSGAALSTRLRRRATVGGLQSHSPEDPSETGIAVLAAVTDQNAVAPATLPDSARHPLLAVLAGLLMLAFLLVQFG